MHEGSVLLNNPDVAQKLPAHYHKWLLVFDPRESEKRKSSNGCDHRIMLKVPDRNLRMGSIYQ